jgi:DNA recombination protein RmuC
MFISAFLVLGSFIFGSLFAYYFLSQKHARYVLESEKEKALLSAQADSLKNEALLKEKILQEKFEVFAQDLMKKSQQNLETSSSKSFENILKPLSEKIKDFEKKVESVYQAEARERFNLKKEIERMAYTSENLGKALRGDFKTQGIWGEIILEKVLEASGLREGFEYTTQGRDLQLKNEEGSRFKPDVIIHLPEDRHLIIDSKVSLSAFEKWVNTENENEKAVALKSFASAVRLHVQGLSEKHYQNLKNLRSPDFVFLFFPIETALIALYENDPNLFQQAWNRKVVLVGPSTLLPTLKTVESIWKNEKQNQNALEIARSGGLLYDKFVLFCEDLISVGKSLQGAQSSYEEAMKKLRDGKGNLLRQSERLKEFGVRSQKQIPQGLQSFELE